MLLLDGGGRDIGLAALWCNHPEALKQIRGARLPTEGLRSKSREEFAGPEAPRMHFVCGRATL